MRRFACSAFCLAMFSLTGCVGAFDPYQRPYDWSARGAPEETIAQQAANPADLISGASEPTTNGTVAAAGIDKTLGAGGTGNATGLQQTLNPTSNTATINSQ